MSSLNESYDAYPRIEQAFQEELDGSLVREPSGEDRRAKAVRLTAAAKDFLAALHRAHHNHPRRRHAHWGEEQRTLAKRLVDLLVDHYAELEILLRPRQWKADVPARIGQTDARRARPGRM